ncbi:MAG: branched-chain amino acid ABC transporter permease [Chloroflexi bacterium]|nr:branched-chain amino acid ABC transporter permease [Chloroflexota bacterium]
MNRQWIPRIAGIAAIVLLLIFPFIYGRADYDFIMHLWITAFFYAILASSWSLLAGYAGQFSFAHMAFMAIGAYVTALYGNYIRFVSAPTNLCTEYQLGGRWLVILNPVGVTSLARNCLDIAKETLPAGTVINQPSIWWGLFGGIIIGGIFGLLVGYLVLRLRSTYLALFTIGFAEILRAAISAEIAITQGQSGLEMLPLFPNGVNLFGQTFSSTDKLPPYYIMLFLFLICMVIMLRLTATRFGLFIRSLREDEEAAAALGVNVVRYKVMVFTITAMMAAAAGAIFGHYIGIITPNILLILQMSLVIAMAVIGGLESIVAAAIGAIVILFMLELLRTSFTIGTITVDMTLWRLVFFGAVLMLTLRFRRNGLIAPILDWFERADVAEETVAKRQPATTTEGSDS